ncbi:MAG: restriction endonuclease subunit S [Bacteroidales bacterium]
MMMGEWKIYRLGDVAHVIKEGYMPALIDSYVYIGLEHIEQQTLKLASTGSSNDITSNKFRFKNGDVLFGKLRPYFRKVYRPKFNGVCSTDIWVVRSKGAIDQGFLFYYMANPEFIEMASQGSTGTRMPRADWHLLQKIEIKLPPLTLQHRIAEILGALDDKIELNRQMNQTLEELAQTLFKHYFVNGIDPENLPEGWRMRKIKEFGQVVCGKTPSKSIADNFGGGIPFIKIPDMHGNVFITNTEDSLTEQGANIQRNKYIPEGSICVSCIATVGLVGITTKSSQTNQQINTLIPRCLDDRFYLFQVFRELRKDLSDMGSGGTATLNVNTSLFSNIEIIDPPDIEKSKYHLLVAPAFELMLSNDLEVNSLQEIRDYLLPKLISGEITPTDLQPIEQLL